MLIDTKNGMSELPLARSNTYEFLGSIYLLGLNPDLIPYIQSIPELASIIDSLNSYQGEKNSNKYDDLAADHYHIFGLNVHPYESAFLEIESILDGEVTESVQAFYWQSGYPFQVSNDSADHIGLEMNFLGYLCKTEMETEYHGRVESTNNARLIQLRFIETHLLRWIPGFIQAVRRQHNSFYTTLAELTLDVLLEHYLSLSQKLITGQIKFDLPSPPDLLEDQNTSLRDITRYLLTPAYSGVYLSRDEINAIARRHNLPHGFGKRQQILVNLLRNAADYELVSPLIHDINTILNDWRAFYIKLPKRIKNELLLEAFTQPWLERISKTEALLEQIQAASISI